MKFYWCAKTRAFRIAWLLEELGQPYERIAVDIRTPLAERPAHFLAVSPMGKVPALEDGEACLADSGAICIWLAERFPQAGLAPPAATPARARWLQWVLFTNTVVEPSMAEKFAGLEARPTSYGWGSFDIMLATFRKQLASTGPWILGEAFSSADVLMGTSALYLSQFGLVKGDALLEAYVARCQARPAFQRAAAFDA
jgi:glutathione S-transferase